MRNYLVQQSSGWIFRLKIPQDLQLVFGKSELRYALNTGSLLTAKKQAKIIAKRLKALFEELRMSETKLTRKEINSLVREYIESVRNDIDETYSTEKTVLNPETYEARLEALTSVQEEYQEKVGVS